MAQVLFITREDIVSKTPLGGNVDTDKFIFFIKQAQDIHIQNILGTKLFEKLQADIAAGTLSGNYETLVDSYVKDVLIHYALSDYLPFASVKIDNGGVFIPTSENAETASKSRIDFLVQKVRDKAEYYSRRLIDYLTFNNRLFPEYNQNTNDDIYPSSDSNFHGWVLALLPLISVEFERRKETDI